MQRLRAGGAFVRALADDHLLGGVTVTEYVPVEKRVEYGERFELPDSIEGLEVDYQTNFAVIRYLEKSGDYVR